MQKRHGISKLTKKGATVQVQLMPACMYVDFLKTSISLRRILLIFSLKGGSHAYSLSTLMPLRICNEGRKPRSP